MKGQKKRKDNETLEFLRFALNLFAILIILPLGALAALAMLWAFLPKLIGDEAAAVVNGIVWVVAAFLFFAWLLYPNKK